MKFIFISLLALLSANVEAKPSAVYEKSFKHSLDTAHARIKTALESNGFKVVYELNMFEKLSKFVEKNGIKDFNLNRLEDIKSMVFCNGPLAVKISNADPAMLALCPLHVTLTQKAGRVSVLFVRPGVVALGSKAEAPAKELEEKIINTIEGSLNYGK